MKKLVYLAGPISGLSYEGATNWRQYAITKLHPLVGLSPMRGKDYLLDELDIDANTDYGILSTAKAIVARDRFDCQRADCILFNLSESQKVSIGTMIEFGWADAARIPKVVVTGDNTVHTHAMVNQLSDFVAKDLDEGINIVKTILVDGIL